MGGKNFLLVELVEDDQTRSLAGWLQILYSSLRCQSMTEAISGENVGRSFTTFSLQLARMTARDLTKALGVVQRRAQHRPSKSARTMSSPFPHSHQ
jgi:hypothetical protein